MKSSDSRVVIVGGGFGGLSAARELARSSLEVTMVDRRNFHLFQPLLYQVAAGGLAPGDIATPLRAEFKNRKNVKVLQAEVTDFDLAQQKLLLKDEEPIPFDYLIVATGSKYNYFGRDDFQKTAPSLKTIEDALLIRRRVFEAFEEAEKEPDPQKRLEWLTFVIVGGGPTGVEMAGTLAELAHFTLRGDFRTFDPREARIILVEGIDRILPPFPPELSHRAAESLGKLGVTIKTKAMVTSMDSESVTLKTEAGEEVLRARTILWAAGVQASSLGGKLAAATSTAVDRVGRLIVEPDLSLAGHDNIFVIGDLAHFAHGLERPLPGVAQPAIQQGRYVARLITARARGRSIKKPFRYWDKGNMAVIGRNAAVADLGRAKLSGFPAWLIWAGVHIAFLVNFESRFSVMFRWLIEYFTRKRGARLITGEGCEPAPVP